MARFTAQERAVLKARLKHKLEEYTYADLVGLISDLIPKKGSTQPLDSNTRVPSPICTIIAAFLVPLLSLYGGAECLTPKGGLKSGPARDRYLEWYMELRGAELMRGKPTRTVATIRALALIQAREALAAHLGS